MPWAPLRCNAPREIAAMFADLDPSQDWADTELPEPEPEEECFLCPLSRRRVVTRLREVRSPEHTSLEVRSEIPST